MYRPLLDNLKACSREVTCLSRPLLLFWVAAFLAGCIPGTDNSADLTSTQEKSQPGPTETSAENTIEPEPTAIPSPEKTYTPSPEPTLTPSPEPAASSTPEPTVSPTSEPAAKSAGQLAAACRDTVDELRALTGGLELPDHFEEVMPAKSDDDFDVNSFFSALDHLSLEEDYTLDFVYFSDELGGKPMVYAREIDQPSFATYTEFIESKGGPSFWERSYGTLEYAFEYLDYVHVDDTEEGYLQFAQLVTIADQFYLFWHGLYHDEVIMCDQSDVEKAIAEVEGFDLELPDEIVAEAQKLDFEPTVTLDDENATIRFVIFTKWGGFIDVQYALTREYPHRLVDASYEALVEYDCGISF